MTTTHTIVMTGASRGIGRVAAERILADDPGAHLLLLTRTSAQTLATDLSPAGDRVSTVPADLTSLDSTRAAATQITTLLEQGAVPPLRGFVGNAGIQHTDALTRTDGGLEATFTVNVLANHLLIRSLQNHFAPGARITITVSDTHFGDFKHNMGMVPGPRWRAPADLAEVAAFDNPSSTAAGRTAYSTSKLATIYLVHEHARRLPEHVDVVSYNPGFVPGTDLARHADTFSRFLMGHVMPLMTHTPLATSQRDAGQHLADVATGRLDVPSGAYVDRAQVTRSSPESYDPDRETQLWDVAERLCTPTRH